MTVNLVKCRQVDNTTVVARMVPIFSSYFQRSEAAQLSIDHANRAGLDKLLPAKEWLQICLLVVRLRSLLVSQF